MDVLRIAAFYDASLGGNSAGAIKKEGEQGIGFKYKTADTEVMGWLPRGKYERHAHPRPAGVLLSGH